MIGVLLFLGSAGFLACKSASSQIATAQLNAHTSRLGLNIDRQMELERLFYSSSPALQEKLLSTLIKVDTDKTSMPLFFEQKKQIIIDEFERFFKWRDMGLKGANTPASVMSRKTRDLTVWLISQNEGWTYNKTTLSALPEFCYGYSAANDQTVRKLAKRI